MLACHAIRCPCPKFTSDGRHSHVPRPQPALRSSTSARAPIRPPIRTRALLTKPPHITAAPMTALYKPTEAISLLRPSLLLPRIQPSSTRRARAGVAFSTTRNAQATPSFPGSPIPGPPRKSITLTGDTGRVRWTELSPGEKVVRTTQQSFNLVVIAIGVIATV